MSVSPRQGYEIPDTTVTVAKAAFPKGCLAIRIRDEFGELFADKDFVLLYGVRGRPGFSPARLAMVSVLQFLYQGRDPSSDGMEYGLLPYRPGVLTLQR